MHDFNLKSLKIINAIIENKTMLEAARALGISPSSISQALTKLRLDAGSKLFMRTKHGLIPNERALELQRKYKEILLLSEARREFIITTYTPIELLIGLHMQELEENFHFLQFQTMSDSTENRLMGIRQRVVDIDIGSKLPEDRSVICFHYVLSRVCIITSKSHSTIRHMFDRHHWFDNGHAVWGRGNDIISSSLSSMDSNRKIFDGRKIVYESNCLLSMIYLCSHSDVIMIVPEIFVKQLKEIFPIKSFELPWELPWQFDFYIHYHHSLNDNPGIQKLISLFDKIV